MARKRIKPKPDSTGILDHRTIDCPSFDLAKRRKELEVIVADYVTSKRTNEIIEFKGKQRYLKAPLPTKRIYAVLALQLLYAIEAARKVGDIDKALRLAVQFGAKDFVFELFEQTGVDCVHAAFSKAHQRRGQVQGGKNSTKWTPEIEELARPIYDEIHETVRSKDAAARRTLAALYRQHQITNLSLTTLKRGLGLIKK